MYPVSICALLASITYTMAHTEIECIQACLNKKLHYKSYEDQRANCRICLRDPPLGMQLCSVAARYPYNPYLERIADICVKDVELSDTICIVACMNIQYPHFNQLCNRCRKTPPITDDMCIFSCDRTALLSPVCYECKENPPLSPKLCEYACDKRRSTFNVYYKDICKICNPEIE